MVKLAFPNAKVPSNSNNSVEYSQIQVQDYDLSRIQDNISQYTRNLAKHMEQKDEYTLLAQNSIPISMTTPAPLVLKETTNDEYQTYNLTSGSFTAPQDALYAVTLYGVATITAGAPTVLFIDILPSNGTVITQGFPLVGGVFYINMKIPFQLTQGTKLTITVRTDAPGTISLSATTRLYVSWQ